MNLMISLTIDYLVEYLWRQPCFVFLKGEKYLAFHAIHNHPVMMNEHTFLSKCCHHHSPCRKCFKKERKMKKTLLERFDKWTRKRMCEWIKPCLTTYRNSKVLWFFQYFMLGRYRLKIWKVVLHGFSHKPLKRKKKLK